MPAQDILGRLSGESRAPLPDKDARFRQAYVQLFVCGPGRGLRGARCQSWGVKAALAGAIAARLDGYLGGVPGFERKWWAVQGSNLYRSEMR